VHAEDARDRPAVYRVAGQVFFASADMLVDAFDVREIEAARCAST
jgi:SulP family sulfate permease